MRKQKNQNLLEKPEKTKKNKSPKKGLVLLCIIGFLYVLSYVIYIVGNWTKITFKVGIESILFTITNPTKGANSDLLKSALLYCIPRILIVVAIVVFFIVLAVKNKEKYNAHIKFKKIKFSFNLNKFTKILACLMSIICLCFSLLKIDRDFKVSNYIKARKQVSTIYEDYYVDPFAANINIAKNERKNIIQIYVESMESTYFSTDDGGKQNKDYIPNLKQYALENISFSNSEKLGGFRNTTGTTWTMGALMALTSGVPYAFPIDSNNMGNHSSFAKNLVTMGDVLEKNGYRQYFQCGSDGDFAGRSDYFKQHGNYEILDLQYAKDKGYIPKDYFVWWGYEDYKLFDIAKKELTQINILGEPFNYSLLTVDTHFPEGYMCDHCERNYPSPVENVLDCVDKQIFEFVEWCKQQPFYDNTIIVIVGDHQRMDSWLMDGVAESERMIYNCIINCDKTSELGFKNRTITTMDMFPTIMAAMGFNWTGDRLGLGTNLFSSTKTLAEIMTFDTLNAELVKTSNFYEENFY